MQKREHLRKHRRLKRWRFLFEVSNFCKAEIFYALMQGKCIA